MRSNFNAPLSEAVSVELLETVARSDYASIVYGEGYSKSDYIDDNLLAYYTCANTWILVSTDQGSELLGQLLRASIKEVGLLAVIKTCAGFADHLVLAAHKAVRLSENDAVPCPELPELESSRLKEFLLRTAKLPFVVARQILTYPKRFAPYVPNPQSRLHKDGIAAFAGTNAENVKHGRRIDALTAWMDYSRSPKVRELPFKHPKLDEGPGGWGIWYTDESGTSVPINTIATVARRILSYVVGEYKGTLSGANPRLGPGACRNAGMSQLERLTALIQYEAYRPTIMPTASAYWNGMLRVKHPDLRDRFFRVPDRRRATGFRTIVVHPRTAHGFWGFSPVPQICRVTSVPKSYKAVRLIALEDLFNMSRQLHLKDALDARMKKVGLETICPIHNQEENRKMAYHAALTDRFATVDQSHASDSVLKETVRQLFPSSWNHAFQGAVPYAIIFKESDGVAYPLHMFATMGCGCTFIVEDLVFFALSAATLVTYKRLPGVGLCEDLNEDSWSILKDALTHWLRVMGDDIIILSEVLPQLKAVLAFYGFSVNSDKTFDQGRFRESCGADWLRCDERVIDVTPVYWPRIPIKGSIKEVAEGTYTDYNPVTGEREVHSQLARLIALQHALYYLSPKASRFLFEFLQAAEPALSTSFPEEHDLTLWTNSPEIEYVLYDPDLTTASAMPFKEPEYYRPLDSAAWNRICQELAIEGELSDHPKDIATLESSALCRILAYRRRVFTVPAVEVSERSTRRVPPGAAEAILYDFRLQALDAEAFTVLPCVRIDSHGGVTHEIELSSPGLRPGRLSESKLVAAAYTTTLKHIIT